MRRPGKISPTKAARMLDVHPNTVRSWACKTLLGNESRLIHVERHALTGYLFIDLEEIKELKKKINE